MLHTNFHGNRPACSGEEIFEGFFTIYGLRSHLGYVTSIMSSDFHFLVPESFKQNLFQIGTEVSEKIQF